MATSCAGLKEPEGSHQLSKQQETNMAPVQEPKMVEADGQ